MTIREMLQQLLTWRSSAEGVMGTPPHLPQSPPTPKERRDPRLSQDAVVPLPSRFRTRSVQPSRVDRLVFVGLDFGTSGTKVVFRDQLGRDRTPYAVDFGTSVPGFSRFSYPSAVAIEGDEILLGSDAELAAPPAAVLRSVKMALLARHERRDAHWERALTAAAGEGEIDFPYDCAAALLLADVVRRVNHELERTYPGILLDSEVNFGLDVPVDHTDPPEAQARFRQLLDRAVRLSGKARPRMRIVDVREAWRAACTAVSGGQESESRQHLVPEAVAIIEGLRGFAVAGWGRNYAVVDIGAGTTDIGIFRAIPLKTGDRVPFLAASTQPIGCDDVDRLLSDAVAPSGSADNALVARVREAKTALSQSQSTTLRYAGTIIPLSYTHLQAAVSQVEPHLRTHLEHSFGSAYGEDRDPSNWSNLHIVVVGGGSLLEPMRVSFGNQLPHRPFCNVTLATLGSVTGDVGIAAVGASQVAPADSDLPFLIPALGLSIPAPLMREFAAPSSHPRVAPTPSGPTGLYDYESADT